jgi:hypothetical protein
MKLTDALGVMAVPLLGGLVLIGMGLCNYQDFYAELETMPPDIVSNVVTPVGMIAIGTVIMAASVIIALALCVRFPDVPDTQEDDL